MGKVFLNGNWIERDKALVSVFDRGFMFGDAVYEVLAVSKGKIRYLKEHLKRIESHKKPLNVKKIALNSKSQLCTILY